MDDLSRIVDAALTEFAACGDAAALENAKARYLGKGGSLTEQLKGLGKLSAAERPAAGARHQRGKGAARAALNARRAALADAKLEAQLAGEALDVTLPGRGLGTGTLHPITRTLERVEALFRSLGLHRGRRSRDRGRLPQLHRAQHAGEPPCPLDAGHVLRRGRHGAAHAHVADPDPLHGNARAADQDHRAGSRSTASTATRRIRRCSTRSRGLWIDRDVSFADLKGVFTEFLRNFFERDDIKVRFRPSFFPFTEPSAEIDMAFGDGGWLELAGSGQVHPNVLRAVGLDPQKWQGFAFGMGPDRLAMLRYGVNDLRALLRKRPALPAAVRLKIHDEILRTLASHAVQPHAVARGACARRLRWPASKSRTLPPPRRRSAASWSPPSKAWRGTRTRTGCRYASSMRAAPSVLQIVCGAPNAAAGYARAVRARRRHPPRRRCDQARRDARRGVAWHAVLGEGAWPVRRRERPPRARHRGA
jgi:phenylalanyl-tRNA synthetase alpha chain